MKIIIPGGSGQVGTMLARAFSTGGHDVVVLSRTVGKEFPWRTLLWDGKAQGEWTKEFEGADVIINLAGRVVNCRYNEKNRREIMDSRVDSTKAVGEAILNTSNPPKLWLQASTATIYPHSIDVANDEYSATIGCKTAGASDAWDFSVSVAQNWEQAAISFQLPNNTRLVLMRSAVTMSPDKNGIFDVMLSLVRKGLGGTAASGKQFVSWVHERDFIRSIYWLIEHEELSGAINISSPNPLTNREFMRIFREQWGTTIGLPATKLMLEVGAYVMGTETELVLKSRRVIPTRLLNSGFEFEFPHWQTAVKDLCAKWRNNNQ